MTSISHSGGSGGGTAFMLISIMNNGIGVHLNEIEQYTCEANATRNLSIEVTLPPIKNEDMVLEIVDTSNGIYRFRPERIK